MTDTFLVEKLHPITRTLLEKRGVVGEEAVRDFLFPSYEKHIGDPFGIHGVAIAVDRIVEAMKSGEKIAVYSDYDCDGVPGGVLLRTFFDDIGYPVEMYIPHRHNEGYGVHIHAIDTLKEKGVTLVITVDLAITNIEEIAYAKSIGVDCIVTDHHLPITQTSQTKADHPSTHSVLSMSPETRRSGQVQKNNNNKKLKAKGLELKAVQVVPDAVAVINSKQDVCTYHDDMLCGCAVAWKLSCALLSRLRESADSADLKQTSQTNAGVQYKQVLEKVKTFPKGWEKWMLDLVAISTVADMVPLVKENRALAHFGLKVLRKTKRPGLLHIFNAQRMKLENLMEDDIAFTIAPRINAAGRMGDPIQAHMMLYEKDVKAAEGYAHDLEELNTQRKCEVKDIVSTLVFDQNSLRPGRELANSQNDVIVVGDISWGPGILGLIAQNIIDETGKPVFVWGQGDDTTSLKGSCRSKGDIHVVELMARVGHDTLTHWGGHEQAGGFSVAQDKVKGLSAALNEAYKHVEKKDIGSHIVKADVEISIDDISNVTYKAIEVLAPFGIGNPKPIFEIKNVTPLATKWFGKKNEHFEITYPTSRGSKTSLRQGFSGHVKAIQFFAPKDIEEKTSKPHTLLAHLEKSYFAGKTELRMRVVEVR